LYHHQTGTGDRTAHGQSWNLEILRKYEAQDHIYDSNPNSKSQPSPPQGEAELSTNKKVPTEPPSAELGQSNNGLESHHVLFSVSTGDRKYFNIDFLSLPGRNPNIIPHPTHDQSWLVVAQQVEDNDHESSFEKIEIACAATFQDGTLRCVAEPSALPITATPGGQCVDDLAVLNLLRGPHDARAFWGPHQPYIIYGSNSLLNCLGQFTQDLRMLIDGWKINEPASDYRKPTELHRPPPLSPLEKNWFFFWDNNNQMYAHYDIFPKRVFSQISLDGFSGPNLAAQVEDSDDQCLSKHLPSVIPEFESIHQATNSLLITLCDRKDLCTQNGTNRYIFTIFQHKSYRNFHAVYEPYVLVFQYHAPFKIYGISRRPLWIHGREYQSDGTSEMLYVTSISWKNHDQQYHGYLDDTLFLAFGIEDKRMAAIDIRAKDIMDGLELC
jgi:hypothetical protein